MPSSASRRSIGARRNPASAEAILDAAAALLAEEGPERFSIEAVARRAGAGKPTIYRWWPNRVALLLDVYAREKIMDIVIADQGDLAADLAIFIAELWRFWRETPAGRIFRLVVAEAQSDPGAAQALAEFMAERRRHFGFIVDRATARGELAGERAEALLFDALSGLSWQRLLTGRLDEEPGEIAAIAAYLARGAGGGARTGSAFVATGGNKPPVA